MAHYDLSYDANSSDSEESHRFISSQTADDNSLKTIGTSFRAHPDYNKCRIWFYLSLLSLFSATGGFLFGYDTGVVSGAMIKIDEHFRLNAEWHEVIVASTIGAAAIASIASGVIAEWIGRKPLLLMASCVFTVGAGIMAGSVHRIMLLSGRVIVGLGIGAAAMGVPMYIAESAPTHMRGKLVVMNSLFLTGGQFIATVIDGAFSNVDEGWRYMLGLAVVPSLIMFVGFMFLPESPRWLVFQNKEEKAFAVLCKLRHPSRVHAELITIIDDYKAYNQQRLGCQSFVVKFVTSRSLLLALSIGCGLQMFQQLCGINTVMYYSASILQMAGFDDTSSIWLAALPAFGNFFFTIFGLILVDLIGRRKLLLSSTMGVVLGLALLSVSFWVSSTHSPPSVGSSSMCNFTSCGSCIGNSQCGFCAVEMNSTSYTYGTCSHGNRNHSYFNHTVYNETANTSVTLCDVETVADFNGTFKWFFNTCPDEDKVYSWLTVISLFVYIMFFAPGMGALPWTINSEIYPNWARSTCISMATGINWSFNLLVSLTFLTLSDHLGQPITFGMYAGLAAITVLFVFLLLPETKGRSLEDMEHLFKVPHFVNMYRWVCKKIFRKSRIPVLK